MNNDAFLDPSPKDTHRRDTCAGGCDNCLGAPVICDDCHGAYDCNGRCACVEITTAKLAELCKGRHKWIAFAPGLGVERVRLKKLCARLGPRLARARDTHWTLDLHGISKLRVEYLTWPGSRGRIDLWLQPIPTCASRDWCQ